MTVRYVGSVRPDLVASVSTVGSPNFGIKAADKVAAVAPDGSIQAGLIYAAFEAFGAAIEFLGGDSDAQDGRAFFTAVSPATVATFNTAHPDH